MRKNDKNISLYIVRGVYFCLIFLLIEDLYASENLYIGIQRFTIKEEAVSYYSSFDVLLFQRLNFELLPRGIKPILLTTDTIPSECIAIASGIVEMVEQEPYLLFKIRGTGINSSEEETKKIPLKDQSVDGVVDIMVLKIRHFLEQNISGKLKISSVPLDCEIFLDGIKIGKTPADLILAQGNYKISIEREFFWPYRDSLTIIPGKETSVFAELKFRGYMVKPWLVSALFFSSATIVAQILELKFRRDYLSLRKERRESFEVAFERYKTANQLKIGMLIPTSISWSIYFYGTYHNRILKRQIIEKK
ncbi:MAG: PEGA domain-containing protein [Chitinispirillaceae bacterium]|nr:PEGA domain-containing protein [Chitinispirillaceae bacterium]